MDDAGNMREDLKLPEDEPEVLFLNIINNFKSLLKKLEMILMKEKNY